MRQNKNNALSTTTLIKQLWESGYFSNAHDVEEVKKEISTFGFNIPTSVLSVSLMRIVRAGKLLTRSKRTGVWKYIQKYPPKIEGQKNSNIIPYKIHPRIKEVSWKQYREGFFKEAIQNALVEVVDQVKIKTNHPKSASGKELDGDDLMNRIFGCDNQQPVIKFNELENSLDKAEQRGIMNLFKGIVGIRDRKAHLNFIQNDPLKAMEYLALASLLLRLLDENSN